MDSSQKLDLSLIGISIELLGNKIYDINGNPQNELINLFKALPESHRKNHHRNENSNDLLCSLGLRLEDDKSIKYFINEQFDLILKEANQTSAVNANAVLFLGDLKFSQGK